MNHLNITQFRINDFTLLSHTHMILNKTSISYYLLLALLQAIPNYHGPGIQLLALRYEQLEQELERFYEQKPSCKGRGWGLPGDFARDFAMKPGEIMGLNTLNLAKRKTRRFFRRLDFLAQAKINESISGSGFRFLSLAHIGWNVNPRTGQHPGGLSKNHEKAMDPVPRNAQYFLGIVVEIDNVSQRNTWTLSGEVILQQSVWNIQSLCTYMGFSWNRGNPQIIHVSRRFSLINHPFWVLHLWKPPYLYVKVHKLHRWLTSTLW